MNRSYLLGGLATFAAASAAFAAPLSSGLQPGQSVTPFHPKHLAGPLAGTTNCFPCTFQNRPQVQVWVNGDDSKNVAALAGTLSKAMKTYKGSEFKALVVVLTDSAHQKQTEAMVTKASKMPELAGVGMAVLDKTNEAVEAYRINTSADVKNTVFAYKNWKVADTFVNLKADGGGLAKLNTAIGQIAR